MTRRSRSLLLATAVGMVVLAHFLRPGGSARSSSASWRVSPPMEVPELTSNDATEGLFRRARTARAAQQGAVADAALASLLGQGPSSPAFARAVLELGHGARRDGRLADALTHYALVRNCRSASDDQRDAALFWTGRVQHDSGNESDALRAWRLLVRHGTNVNLRVRACDWAVRALLAHENALDARCELDRLHTELQLELRDESEFGQRLRSALARAKGLRELAEHEQRNQSAANRDTHE